MRIKKRKCRHCKEFFRPSNTNHQKHQYCKKPECRKASSRASSAKYRSKEENQTIEKRKEESERVKKWQRKNPDYWKNRKKSKEKSKKISVLRDFARGKNDNSKFVLRDFVPDFIMSLLLEQEYVMNGFLAQFSGVLRDDVCKMKNRFYDKGREVSQELVESKFKNLNRELLNETKRTDLPNPNT